MGKTISSYIHIIPIFCVLFGQTATAATANLYGGETNYRRRPVAVSISPATTTLTASQTQTFQATVSGSRNTAVTWSLSAPVGTISSSGVYTAPSTISATTTVTVQATSVAYPSKFAQATVTLTPPPAVSITVNPGSVTLAASQTQQFTATVSGSSNTGVTWSLSAAVGSISTSGLYSAPATVSASQTVTVTATAAADPTKTARAVITLNATPVSITLSPASVTLAASQTQQFTASVSGSSNTAVNWSLSAAVGSISTSGLYSAPATVTAPQTVTATATSAADPTKTAMAIITLNPPLVSITIGPGPVTLNDSQSQQFTATVTGSSNTGVTWSLGTPVGTISSTGLYAAPANIGATQTITITATSAADVTKMASVTITLAPEIGLNWAASLSSGIAGYNVYRSTTTGGPYARINPALVAVTNFNDPAVQKGTYYYYVATSVTASGQESPYSTEVQVLEP